VQHASSKQTSASLQESQALGVLLVPLLVVLFVALLVVLFVVLFEFTNTAASSETLHAAVRQTTAKNLFNFITFLSLR